jgi:hypothetical protein
MAALMVTLQAPVPLHAPAQPPKIEPVSGDAERDIVLPVANWLLHIAPQDIPAGVLSTVPVPDPVFATVRGIIFWNKYTVPAPPFLLEMLPFPLCPPEARMLAVGSVFVP